MLIDINHYNHLKSVEMKTDDQITAELNVSKNWLMRFESNLHAYDQEGVVQDWIRVYGLMYDIQQFRGKTYKEDELMADFRGIFRKYLNNPVAEEPPTNDDIVWVFNQLCEEEGASLFNPVGEDHFDVQG